MSGNYGKWGGGISGQLLEEPLNVFRNYLAHGYKLEGMEWTRTWRDKHTSTVYVYTEATLLYFCIIFQTVDYASTVHTYTLCTYM